MSVPAPRPPALVLAVALLGCSAPLLDEPDKLRRTEWFLPPLYTSELSLDGSSSSWSAAFWLAGRDEEADRVSARALPLWWHERSAYGERTLWFPLAYSRRTLNDEAAFASLLWGYEESEAARTDYVLLPFFRSTRSKLEGNDAARSGLLFVYDWRRQDGQQEVVLVPLLGLAHLARVRTGLPAAAGGSSRRIEVLNLLNLVTLFGYDDVGDRRELRAFTLLGSEVLSPLRSWRDRDGGPFVREWLFPLYMNVQDEGGGWAYAGPLWGEWSDAAASTRTDWWLLGLLARTSAPEGQTWRVLGLPVVEP